MARYWLAAALVGGAGVCLEGSILLAAVLAALAVVCVPKR